MHGFLIKTALAKTFVYHKQNFYPLRNREVKSLVGLVVVTRNIYTIRVSDLPHISNKH